MRKILKQILKKEVSFTGFFERYGVRDVNGKQRKTLILREIYGFHSNKEFFIDHMWFKNNKRIEKVGALSNGDVLMFDAVVEKYVKSNNNIDFCLNSIKRFRKCDE